MADPTLGELGTVEQQQQEATVQEDPGDITVAATATFQPTVAEDMMIVTAVEQGVMEVEDILEGVVAV